ncbi:MAG: hypothetical protein ACOYYS_22935 [Chloroflexota bacterium]
MNEKESIPSKNKHENRLQRATQNALRWMLVTLSAFGLGALLIGAILYFPTRHKLDQTNAELERISATLASQSDQITILKTDNETLQTKLHSATLHISVLQVLSDVRAASLAVAVDDYAGAHLALSQVTETLDTLSDLLGTEQKNVLTALQQNAAQALTEAKTDLKSAQPTLDQLTKNLVQLQNNLFPNP